MLDPRYVADHLEEVGELLARRSQEAPKLLLALDEVYRERRTLIGEVESLQARRNAANAEMAGLAKGADSALFAERRQELRTLSERIKELETRLAHLEHRVSEHLLHVPNTPHESTPRGQSEEHNPVVRIWGEPPKFDFEPLPHWEIGSELGILDFERAAKLSGARFAVLWGAGARLERALIGFMLDLHTRQHGYREVYPPFLVKADALRGTGQLPKFEADLFKTHRQRTDPGDSAVPSAKDLPEPMEREADTALYLIPTAEVPVTNLHADEMLDGDKLPLAYTAYTPCFRSEAGSYGKDVRGLIRQHQFDKVELVRFVTPDSALAELERLTSHAEEVLRRLGLHYRVVELCAGDLGAAAKKTYDLEVWLPSQQRYREISSCSWFGDYQARRAKIRYRSDLKKKPELLHTLNGSALAVGRTLVAILEQYQQSDGSVLVPDPLRSAMGCERITKE